MVATVAQSYSFEECFNNSCESTAGLNLASFNLTTCRVEAWPFPWHRHLCTKSSCSTSTKMFAILKWHSKFTVKLACAIVFVMISMVSWQLKTAAGGTNSLNTKLGYVHSTWLPNSTSHLHSNWSVLSAHTNLGLAWKILGFTALGWKVKDKIKDIKYIEISNISLWHGKNPAKMLGSPCTLMWPIHVWTRGHDHGTSLLQTL